MKKLMIFTLLFASQLSFGKVLFCKQKVVPVKTEYSTSGNVLTVTYTAERNLKDFSVKNVRGIDGLVVNSFNTIAPQALKKGQSVKVLVEFTKPEGQVFVVTDIGASISAEPKNQSLVIPVGEVSAAQNAERQKNIKSLPGVRKNKAGVNALESDQKYHTMKLPE